MDNLINENPITAEPATAEQDLAAAELGKFKSVKALADAYSNLEAEFTRRSQRLKELEQLLATPAEAKSEVNSSDADENNQTHESAGDGLLHAAMADEGVKQAIVSDYLKTVMQKKSVPMIMGGVTVTAQRQAPKSVKDAGLLAAEYFKKQEK